MYKRQESTTPVSLIDIFPTCLDYAGLDSSHSLDGHSLKPLLENPSLGQWEGNDFSLSACGSKVKSNLYEPASFKNQHFSIRTKQYRYIRCRNGEEELYDHYKDSNEWENLSESIHYDKVLKSMRKRLDNALVNAVK